MVPATMLTTSMLTEVVVCPAQVRHEIAGIEVLSEARPGADEAADAAAAGLAVAKLTAATAATRPIVTAERRKYRMAAN